MNRNEYLKHQIERLHNDLADAPINRSEIADAITHWRSLVLKITAERIAERQNAMAEYASKR